jgi:hypothetical protein
MGKLVNISQISMYDSEMLGGLLGMAYPIYYMNEKKRTLSQQYTESGTGCGKQNSLRRSDYNYGFRAKIQVQLHRISPFYLVNAAL